MKDLIISQEGNTFTLALKGMRSNPSICSNSHRGSRSSEYGLFQKKSSLNICSPKVNITKRKNITLRQLYCEYQSKPNIQYVIRLRNQTSLKGSCGAFDLWVSNLDDQKDDNLQKIPKYKQMEIRKQQKISNHRQQLAEQISEKLLKLTAKMQKKQIQATQQSIKIENQIQNREAKYSFSEYFSQFSQIEHKEHPKPQPITRISIGRDECPLSSTAIGDYREGLNKQAKTVSNTYFAGSRPSDHANKQNAKLASNQMPKKVIGLEFSKNKRFKSTKKKRKACS